MPAKDKYHDNVIRALEKEGWDVVRENMVVGDEVRHLFIDILAKRDGGEAVLIEVKGFEDMKSPMNYLQQVIGQYMMYLAVLDYIGNTTLLYLAVPESAYFTLLSENMASYVIQYVKVKLVIFDPVQEKIIEWIS